MPKHELDNDDPFELVGCSVEGTPADTIHMARCFIEEFFWMGHTGRQILMLFENPEYCGMHRVHQIYGDEWVKALINDVADTLTQR